MVDIIGIFQPDSLAGARRPGCYLSIFWRSGRSWVEFRNTSGLARSWNGHDGIPEMLRQLECLAKVGEM
jgi:hypothetical protein